MEATKEPVPAIGTTDHRRHLPKARQVPAERRWCGQSERWAWEGSGPDLHPQDRDSVPSLPGAWVLLPAHP